MNVSWYAYVVILLLIASATGGCGNYPTSLHSAEDIKRASKDIERICIGFLPISNYPLLSRFDRLKDVNFFTLDGTGANDEKLQALSNITLKGLEEICLLNCPSVTDAGIRHLSKITSLRGIQLEGTSITDDALAIMASKMNLTGVNVANCPKVTVLGLSKLAALGNMKELGFSTENLNQADVIRLIKELKNVKWLSVVDAEGKLDTRNLESMAKEKGISLDVRRTGSLQDILQ